MLVEFDLAVRASIHPNTFFSHWFGLPAFGAGNIDNDRHTVHTLGAGAITMPTPHGGVAILKVPGSNRHHMKDVPSRGGVCG